MSHLGFSAILMDHFDHPRNVGELPDADGVGTAGHDGHDQTTFWIRVRDEAIAEITFKCHGCPSAIASASMTTQLALGKHVDDAAEIAQDTIVTALDGMPPEKQHAAGLAAEALNNAIMNYVTRSIDAELAKKNICTDGRG